MEDAPGMPAHSHSSFRISPSFSRQRKFASASDYDIGYVGDVFKSKRSLDATEVLITQAKARFPSKRNRLRCVRCLIENRKKRKQPIMVATVMTEHSYWLALAANRNAMLGHSISNATMTGCLPTQWLAFLAVFAHATHAIAFRWKPGLRLTQAYWWKFEVQRLKVKFIGLLSVMVHKILNLQAYVD